jgi:hypothetical protein
VRFVRWLGWLLPLSAQACVSLNSDRGESPREPARWVLVERRYADVVQTTTNGDGRVNPDAVVLTFQPLYPEDLNWDVVVDPEDQFVEVVGFTPEGHARPGEIVSATVRVGKAKIGQLYRLSAKPSQTDVRILGEAQTVVRGNETAVFRFTSCTSGRAGIAVGVERIGAEERRTP